MDVLLGLSVPLSIVLWGRWYYALRLVGARSESGHGRVALALVPPFCLAFLFAVLKRLSAASVKSDPTMIVLYVLFGAVWLRLTQLAFSLLGVSARDDVLERGNIAATWAISGQLIGATFCFAGANIGNGPGPEVVAFCALLATTALLLLWFLVDRAAFLADTLTIDRHPGTGIRVCSWLVATGIVLGDAVTGDWKSVSVTTRDFSGYAWPAVAFALLIALLERKLRALGPEHPWNRALGSMSLAVVYIVSAAGYAWKRGIR